MKTHQRFASLLVIAALVGAMLPAVSFAAPKEGRGQGPAVRAIDMIASAAATVSDLGEDQKTKIHAAIEDATAQAAALQAEARANRAKGEKPERGANREARAAVRDLIAQTQQNVASILTDAQRPQFREAIAAARAKAREEREANGGPRRGGKADK